MYADPVRKIQEQLYEQLIAVREGFATTLSSALTQVETASVPAEQSSASSDEVAKLRAENAKLKYRVKHLVKALD